MPGQRTAVSGFEARIMGVPDWIQAIEGMHGPQESAHEYARFDAARTALGQVCADRVTEVDTLFWRRSQPRCHIRCERTAFLAPLADWATERDGTTREGVLLGNAWTESLHLTFLGTSDAIVVPFAFAVPLQVGVAGRATAIPVCSAPRLLREISIANAALNIERKFRNPRVPDFLIASRGDVARGEKREGLDDAFWIPFAANVLRHLATRCVEWNLALIISDRAVEVPPAR